MGLKPIEPAEEMDIEGMFSPAGSSPADRTADVAHSPSSPVLSEVDHALPLADPSMAPLTDQERADIAELAGRIHHRLLNSRRSHSGESQAHDYIMANWWTTLRYITTVLTAVPPPVTVHRPGSVGPADSSATPSPNEEMPASLELMTPNLDLP